MNFVHMVQRILNQRGPVVANPLDEAIDTEWSLSSRQAVEDFLTGLSADHQYLVVHGLDGSYIGHASLVSLDERSVRFQLHGEGVQLKRVDDIRINVWCVLKQGATMFTLHAQRLGLADLWHAPRPNEVIRMQSRRHRRLRCIHGPIHTAGMTMSAPFQDVSLVDLSEEGAGILCRVEADGPMPARASATLWLQGVALVVPGVQVMHSTRLADGNWRIGVRMEGVAEADRRTLRCWLNMVEACQGRTPDRAQAAAGAPTSAVALSSR